MFDPILREDKGADVNLEPAEVDQNFKDIKAEFDLKAPVAGSNDTVVDSASAMPSGAMISVLVPASEGVAAHSVDMPVSRILQEAVPVQHETTLIQSETKYSTDAEALTAAQLYTATNAASLKIGDWVIVRNDKAQGFLFQLDSGLDALPVMGDAQCYDTDDTIVIQPFNAPRIEFSFDHKPIHIGTSASLPMFDENSVVAPIENASDTTGFLIWHDTWTGAGIGAEARRVRFDLDIGYKMVDYFQGKFYLTYQYRVNGGAWQAIYRGGSDQIIHWGAPADASILGDFRFYKYAFSSLVKNGDVLETRIVATNRSSTWAGHISFTNASWLVSLVDPLLSHVND